MTATRTLTLALHLPAAAAKTWQEYLDAHDGDAEKAGKAARADVASRETQNSAARRFVDAYKPLIEHLKLSTSPDDAESASAQALASVKKLQTDAGTSTDASKALEAAHAALREIGIDPADLKGGIEGAKAKFAQAEKAGKLERAAEYSKAAKALEFDADKLAHQLRDEPGVPELRKTKVKVRDANGTETEQEQDVWGVATRDAQGTETAFTPLAEHASVKGFEAALKIASTPTPAPAPRVINLPGQPPAPAPSAGGVKLDLSGGIGTGNAV